MNDSSTARKPITSRTLRLLTQDTPDPRHDDDFHERVAVNATIRLIGSLVPLSTPVDHDRPTLTLVTEPQHRCTCGKPTDRTDHLHGERLWLCEDCGRVAAMLRHPAGKGR